MGRDNSGALGVWGFALPVALGRVCFLGGWAIADSLPIAGTSAR